MKVGIMQPYFFPYIGYFQLLKYVDVFVLHDLTQYTKKGWINRNRILVNDQPAYISLPLKKQSSYLNIGERMLSDSSEIELNKVLNKIQGTYHKAPYFKTTFEFLNTCIPPTSQNLFEYLYTTLKATCDYLDIETKLLRSSNVHIDHSLRSQDMVIALSEALNASQYINPTGGKELYSKKAFLDRKMELLFLKSKEIIYQQNSDNFVPWLSIIDVLMYNSKEKVKEYLDIFELE